jgi:septal ring-binding cell division protein DamX
MPSVSEKTARQIEPVARKNVEPSEQLRKDAGPDDRQGVGQTSPRTVPSALLASEVKTEVKESKKTVSQHAGRDGRALFDKRVRASAAWLSGAYTGKYTIQLMMLTSESARKNVEKLLTKPSYFSILDKLYILQKKTTPPTLFLFYGTFPSMDAARQARNTMPIFLRKHHPYALSIADALTKTED